MGSTSSIIETGVDKLVNLVNSMGRISSDDAAKELTVSTAVIMEWADFLEEEGIIKIEYKLTKAFLVSRKLGKKDVSGKAKEFSGKKDVFVRKAEVSLSFLDRESGKLNSLTEEFNKIKQDLGFDIGSVKNELEELKKYEHLKINLDNQIEEQNTSSLEKLQKMTRQISMEKRKYQEMLTKIKKEEEELKKDKWKANSIEESEKLIDKKLAGLKAIIGEVDSKIKTEEENVKASGMNIKKLIQMAERAKTRVEKEKSLIEPIVEKSEKQVEKIKKLQDLIIKKIMAKEKKLKGVKKASKRMKELFKKKLGVMEIIEKVNKDRTDLQNDLVALIKKAKSVQLSSKNVDVGKEMEDIEKKFGEVDIKKKSFEKELKKLSSFFK